MQIESAVVHLAMALGVVALSSTAALGYVYDTCNDTPVRRESNSASYQVMRCSIPEGSQRAADVIYSFDQWNAVYGMWDVFSWNWGTTDCVSIDHANGTNEIYFGVASEMDGAVGVTYVRYDSCFWWFDTRHIVEADIAFDAGQMAEWGNPPCNTYRPFGSRTTMIHEMGHGLGLEHYDDVMNLMMTWDGEGKYCGNFAIEPHPDDAAGGRFLYNSGNHSTDIGASEHRLVGPNNVELNTAPGTQMLCPRDEYTFNWSVGNMGTEGVMYNVAWYLSTDNIISTSDIYVGSNSGAYESANGFNTWSRTITIPSSVAYGAEYYMGTIVDYDDKVAERYWSNNATYMARKIKIRNRADCSTPKPNLVVQSATIDFATRTVSVTVKNDGNGNAGAHLTYIEINQVGAAEAAKPQSQYSASVSGVAAGGSWSSGPIPLGRFSSPRGFDLSSLTTANLVVRADAKNMVEESNESDNIYDANQ